ncbi:MAG: integrase/recombinase XerD [Solirubrobacteraceae bacterium]|nr:integrase/recombinase XerD [Solirubrobacteraceae bacterium]
MPIVGAPAGELTFAIDTFLSQPDMPPNTRRSYATTLRLIEREIGEEPLNAPLLTAIVTQRWDQSSPATWNLRVATVGSFLAYVREQALLEIPGELRLRRRREHHDNTRSIPIASLDRLWQRREIPIRERTLWRMLYETAARADEILGIDIQDLDIPNERARVGSKGRDTDYVFFQAGTARLLPRLLGGRDRGPVFLSHLAPSPARIPASLDLCPVTGRGRLSYRRAEELLVKHTGWTLHQFRHSALTQLAEQNVALPLLMAKSRYRNLRTLQRYARPGPEAVAALTAQHYPARRAPRT